MAELSNSEMLRQFFNKAPVGPLGPGAADVAKYILLNADNKTGLSANKKAEDSNPSLMGRIFDVLSRGNYASANFFKESFKKGEPDLKAAWEGLTGEKKTTFSDVLGDAGIENKALKAGLGLVMDIGLDPTTYIPVAGLARAAKRLRGGEEATKAITDLEKPLGQKLLDSGEPVHPEAFGLPPGPAQPPLPGPLTRPILPEGKQAALPLTELGPKKGFDTPQSQLDLGLPKKINTAEGLSLPVDPAKATKEAKGQIPLNFKDFSIRAEKAKAAKASELVGKVAEGDAEAVAKITPLPRELPKFDSRDLDEIDGIVKGWNDTATAAINKQFPDTLNAKQQVKLYYRAVDAAKRRFKNPNAPANAGRVDSIAYKLYTGVEKAFEAKGLVPRIGTGDNVRLSDVIARTGGARNARNILDEFGDEIKQGSDTWKAIEEIRAAGAITDSKTVKDITDAVSNVKKSTESADVLSDAQHLDLDKFAKDFGKRMAKTSGMSPAGVKATQSLIDMALKSGKSRAQIAVEQNSKMLDDIIATGKSNPKANTVLTRALEKDLGTLPKWAIDNNNATEMFMGRMATWWGQKDLHPMSLNAIGSSAATAAVRGKYLDGLFAPYDLATRHESMKLAQGLGVANTPESAKLAGDITRLMDNLVGQVSGSSVLLRSGVTMDMLNKWMKRYGVGFEFARNKVKDATGVVQDYSKGSDWVNSWKTADITDDPKKFLFKIQEAMEQATREKALFEEIGERFGSQVSGKAYKTKIQGHPYLDGYYFPDDIAKQIPRVIKDWSIPAFHSSSPLLKQYDRVLSMWKGGVTIYRPGHHIRNLSGDVYLGWMDGVNSLRPYTLAAQVQRWMKGAYTDLTDIDRLVELGAVSRNLATPKPGHVLFRNRSGVPFTAEQIAAVAHQKGLLEHTRTIEDIIDMGNTGRNSLLNVQPFGGKVQAFARGASELESHNTRLAHFIDKVEKSRGSDLAEIFEQASRRARKWHPTGLDLTDFEKKYLRRLMPFYSWMRKSLPLLLEGMVMNPGKTVIPAKLYDAIQTAQGIETPGRDDPFPVDQMFPEWIRAQGLGPLGRPEGLLGKLSNQDPEGYIMGGVGLNPLADLGGQLETPGKTLASALTPAIGVPLELATGRKTFTGESITGPDARPGALSQYIGENIPGFSAIQGLTGITPTGGESSKFAKSDTAGREALINWLTAAGIRGTGPYINQARYEQAAPGKMERRLGREELLNKLRSLQGG